MKAPSLTEDAKKVVKRAAQLGAILAVVCNLLPPEHRVICHALADFCMMRW